MRREKHDSSAIIDIKARNKEYRAERVRQLRPLLLNWSQGGRNEMEYQKIYKSQDKQIQNLCHEFKKLSPYIDNEILFDGLAEKYENRKELRNYVNAAVFHAMSSDNAFKADVLAKFDYHTIQNHLRERNIGSVRKMEKLSKIKDVFRIQLRKTDLSNDVIPEFFSCFFKTSRSGSVDKILGLNPLDLPAPLQYITSDVSLLDLFIFP